MKSRQMVIEGMTCGHCVMHVRKALDAIDGVTVEDVKIGRALVSYDETKVTLADMVEAIQKVGYSLAS